MCWSLEASSASFVAGIFAPISLLVFFSTSELPSDALRLCRVVLSVMVLPGFVQLGDTLAHLSSMKLIRAIDPRIIGLLVYASIAMQPAVFSFGLLACFHGNALVQFLLVVSGLGVMLHFVACLWFDTPLESWLVVEVVHRRGSSMCAIVHGCFAYEGQSQCLFGVTSRVGVYFATLLGGVGAAIAAAVALQDAPTALESSSGTTTLHSDFTSTVRMFVFLMVGVMATLLILSEVVVNFVSKVRGHTSSVWCQASLVSLVILGVYVTLDLDVSFALLFTSTTLGLWGLVFVAVRAALAREP